MSTTTLITNLNNSAIPLRFSTSWDLFSSIRESSRFSASISYLALGGVLWNAKTLGYLNFSVNAQNIKACMKHDRWETQIVTSCVVPCSSSISFNFLSSSALKSKRRLVLYSSLVSMQFIYKNRIKHSTYRDGCSPP